MLTGSGLGDGKIVPNAGWDVESCWGWEQLHRHCFEADSNPNRKFPPEMRVDSFDNNSAAQVTSGMLDGYFRRRGGGQSPHDDVWTKARVEVCELIFAATCENMYRCSKAQSDYLSLFTSNGQMHLLAATCPSASPTCLSV